MVKLSIIIPVYNTKKYLDECLKSLAKHIVSEVEILLIDDCSTDNSAEICSRYVKLYDNIKLISQPKNMGVSAARNRGLEESTGDFVTFIDSDDFVSDNYISNILDFCNENYDLTCFGNYNYIHNGDEIYNTSSSGMNVECVAENPTEKSWKTLILDSFFPSSWNKVYRRSLINGLRFNTNCVCYEDYLFNAEYCRRIKNFRIVNESLYFYRQNSTQILSGKRKWGNRYTISNLVAEKTEEFITEKNDFDLSFMRRYVYAAYMSELQFTYHFKNEEFDDAVRELMKSQAFIRAINSIRPAGKYFTLLKLSRLLNVHRIQKKLLEKKC